MSLDEAYGLYIFENVIILIFQRKTFNSYIIARKRKIAWIRMLTTGISKFGAILWGTGLF